MENNTNIVTVTTPTYTVKPTYPFKGMGIAGMVLGIVAWSIGILTFGLLGLITTVLALVGAPLSIVALVHQAKGGYPTGISLAGTILNGTVIGLISFSLIVMAVVGVFGS
jgi:hypothetical protein